MKYLIVVNITEGRFYRQGTFVEESYEDVLKAISEFPYGWKLEKVYEIAREIKI